MKECLVCVDSWTFVHAGMLQLELGLVCRFSVYSLPYAVTERRFCMDSWAFVHPGMLP